MSEQMQNIFEYIKSQIDELSIFSVVNEDHSDLYDVRKKLVHCDKILVFGTGGSSLGGKCLVQYNCFFTNTDPRVLFVENVDAASFVNVIEKCNKDTTGIIVISKSGKTTETLVLFLTLKEMWKDFDHRSNTIVITENSEDNPLRNIANSIGAQVLDHHSDIGGRYSVFSNVGLLPAILNDVDIESFLRGARNVIDEVKSTNEVDDCPIIRDICMMSKVYDTKYEHVVMVYSDAFHEYGKWYSQLLSESIGKDNFGITPIASCGTIDQHSMLQLFLGGVKNKVFTIVTQNIHKKTVKISSDYDIINNKTIADLMIAHQNATIESIKSVASVRVLNFEQFTIETLGFMMMLAFMEIIIIGKMYNINPFDQPSVEMQKNLVKEYLLSK